jgi:DNA topoisomerase-3
MEARGFGYCCNYRQILKKQKINREFSSTMSQKELEKSASRKLKISANETMKIAEKLYTKGYISYPRTETNIFPKDFNLNGLIEQQANNQNWGGRFLITS